MGHRIDHPSEKEMKHQDEKFSRPFIGDGESAFRIASRLAL
jgi:hypothetical protein